LAATIVALSLLPVTTPAQAQGDAATTKACTADKSPKIAEIKQRGVLRWALGIAAPFGAKDAENNYIGADPGSAQELADILGVKLELKDYSYNLLPPTVAAGLADIAGTLYVTEERRKALDFSIPWQQDGQLLATLDSRTEFSSLADLNKPGVRIVTRIGSGQVELAKKLLPNAQIITAEITPGGEAQDDRRVGSRHPLSARRSRPVRAFRQWLWHRQGRSRLYCLPQRLGSGRRGKRTVSHPVRGGRGSTYPLEPYLLKSSVNRGV
jgi:hypothetical protein